jgi:YVTN family beta-propeller protein
LIKLVGFCSGGNENDLKTTTLFLTNGFCRQRRHHGRGNSVSVVDARTLQVVKNISVGQRVWGMGLAAGAGKLYTANGLSNDVSVIDTSTNKMIDTISAGDGPWGVAVRE